MTARQREVLAAVVRHFAETGGPPRLADLAKAMGWASPHSAHLYVRLLARKGWLVAEPGGKRAVLVPRIALATRAAAAQYLDELATTEVIRGRGCGAIGGGRR